MDEGQDAPVWDGVDAARRFTEGGEVVGKRFDGAGVGDAKHETPHARHCRGFDKVVVSVVVH